MFTIGADVEVFMQDQKEIVSSIGLLGGNKVHPRLVPFGNIQEDNVLAEFAIDPCDNEDQFVHNIIQVKSHLDGVIRELGYTSVILPSAILSAKYIDRPEAKVFGCDPDYNGWNYQENVKPDVDEVGNLRTAGGHIHVGYDFESEKDRAFTVHWMDAILGLNSVLMDNSKESSDRRKVYGKAGSFRFKPYGLEYRVLSNFWIKDEGLIRWAYRSTDIALSRALSGQSLEEDAENIQRAINTSNAILAMQLMDKYDIVAYA